MARTSTTTRMPGLEASIARCQSQLRFIPTAWLRQARILALLNEVTETDLSFAQLMDALGNYKSAVTWPPPSPSMLAKMHELGPSLVALLPNSDLMLNAWDRSPGVAFAMPDRLLHASLLFHFVGRHLNEQHMALCPFPEREDGSRVVIFLTRREKGRSYEARHLGATERVCEVFREELSSLEPARLLMPRHPTLAEHSFAMDAEFRPSAPSHYAQTVLALFYGGRRDAVDGSPLLPAALEADLRGYHDTHVSLGDIAPTDFVYAFSKHHLGRVLLINLGATSPTGYRLTFHEDLAVHSRLHRIKAACRRLARDRTTVYIACLLLAEGLRDPVEIARRAGFGGLKASSAQRIINQARRLITEA